MKKFLVPLIVVFIFSVSYGKVSPLKVTIMNYIGNVSVNGKAVSAVGQPIRYGDMIKTESVSMCDILINEKNIIRLGENTKLVFKVSGKDNQLILESGYLAAITRKAFAKGGTYMVRTTAVTAAVRGTSFCTKIESDKSVYFCVCNGKIDLVSAGSKSKETVKSAHHSARRYIKLSDGSINIDKNPGLLYHDDSKLEKMASLIDEQVDWTKPDGD